MSNKPENIVIPGFDASKYLPQGFDAKEFRQIRGLTPIYAPKLAFESKPKWNPCLGYMDRLVELDIGEEDDPNRFREFILMQALAPTKGTIGDRTNVEIVDINIGDDILMPVSGNIKNVTVLRAALADPNKVYVGMFTITGHRPVNKKGSDMWEIFAQIHPNTVPREGRFAIPVGGVHAPQLQGPNPAMQPGQVYSRDGVPQQALVSR